MLTSPYKRFGRDTVFVGALWALSFWIPTHLSCFGLIEVRTILKIFAVVATLQIGIIPVSQWVGHLNAYLIRGFLGGFISSTATFIHLTGRHEITMVAPSMVVRALLLTTMAMLIECVFILVSFGPQVPLKAVLPLLAHICVVGGFLLMPVSKRSEAAHKRHHPLSLSFQWKKVIWPSLFIIGLFILLSFIKGQMTFSVYLGAFLLSLAEAHGVLAAAAGNSANLHEGQMQRLVFLILTGNSLSKAIFIFRVKENQIRGPLLKAMALAISISAVLTFIP